MKQDLITLSEQFPGLMVSVSLDDLLSAGRKLSAEIIDYIADNRDALKSTPAAPEDFITREEACTKLGISETTLWRWGQNGYLSPVKIGAQVRYRLTDIEEMLAKRGGEL